VIRNGPLPGLESKKTPRLEEKTFLWERLVSAQAETAVPRVVFCRALLTKPVSDQKRAAFLLKSCQTHACITDVSSSFSAFLPRFIGGHFLPQFIPTFDACKGGVELLRVDGLLPHPDAGGCTKEDKLFPKYDLLPGFPGENNLVPLVFIHEFV
jgi:hypothetical protein